MALEVEADLEHDTALRQLITNIVRRRLTELELKRPFSDKERAELVEQVLSFYGEPVDAVIEAGIDRELAEEDDDGTEPEAT